MKYRITETQRTIFAEYIKKLELEGKHVKSFRSYGAMFFDYCNKTGLNFLRLRTGQAQDYQVELITRTKEDGSAYYNKATVIKHISGLSAFYSHLKVNKLIPANPFEDIDRVRGVKPLPKNILNEKNMNKFLSHLRDFTKRKDLHGKKRLYQAHVISEVMYSSGIRINELAALKVDDIDFYRSVMRLTDTKAGKEREVILNSFAEKVLRLYVDEIRKLILDPESIQEGLLFGPLHKIENWLNRLLRRESGKLNLGRVTSHHFRHAVGFHLLRGGCDIRYIQEILGHRKLDTTQIYTKVDREDLKGILDRFHPRAVRGGRS